MADTSEPSRSSLSAQRRWAGVDDEARRAQTAAARSARGNVADIQRNVERLTEDILVELREMKERLAAIEARESVAA